MQFSLAKLFVAVTVCAGAIFVWHQLPYPVETSVMLDGICTNGMSQDQTDSWEQQQPRYRQVQYFRQVRGGQPIPHGAYRVYDQQGNVLRSGAYRCGLRHGKFVSYAAGGAKVLEEFYANGSLDGLSHRWNLMGKTTQETSSRQGKRHGRQRFWDPSGSLCKEEHYVNGVREGPFMERGTAGALLIEGQFASGLASGRWEWHLTDGSRIVGRWQEGRADGHWAWYDGAGQYYFEATFERGLVKHVAPDDLSPRVLEEIARPGRDPAFLGVYFTTANPTCSRTTLRELMRQVESYTPPHPIEVVREVTEFDDTVAIPAELADQAPVLSLDKVLKRQGLGYDLRYGRLYVDTPQSIQSWHDLTGISQLTPPALSPVGIALESITELDVVEMQLVDVLGYLSDRHNIEIRLAAEPQLQSGGRPAEELLVTKTLQGLSLRNVLGIVLCELDCQISLQEEMLVVERK